MKSIDSAGVPYDVPEYTLWFEAETGDRPGCIRVILSDASRRDLGFFWASRDFIRTLLASV